MNKLKKQAEIVNEVHALDKHLPFVHEVGVVDDRAYMILDYVNGENGEVALPLKSEKIQYDIGSQVGKTLKHLHSVQAPADHPNWEETWRNRVVRQAPRFKEIVKDNVHYECVLPFIEDNLDLLKNRPSCVQHYDFHPGNILVDEDRFTGLIVMQKITYADPIN